MVAHEKVSRGLIVVNFPYDAHIANIESEQKLLQYCRANMKDVVMCTRKPDPCGESERSLVT